MQLNSEEIARYSTYLRLTSEQILSEHELISAQEFFNEIFGSFTGIGAVLNKYRQIVYVNSEFLQMLGLEGVESILGNRPGEILSCIHSFNKTGGCGTSAACQFCGVHNTIIESQMTDNKISHEAMITTRQSGKYKSLDLKINISPINLSGHSFMVLLIQDISSEKRRLALERIFFHDLLNSAGVLNGLLRLLKEGNSSDLDRQIIDMSEETSREIIEEIQSQRQIYDAETGDLQVILTKVNSISLIDSVINRMSYHQACRDRKIVMTENTIDADFETDGSILQRVLVNLLKNALEATPSGGIVHIGADDMGDTIRFSVKNEFLIPKNIQMQLFQRSFSTKGIGRGLGTYSIRILTENYLKGSVSFTSNESDRTIFMIDLSKQFPN